MKVKQLEWENSKLYCCAVVVLWGVRFKISHCYDRGDVPRYRAFIDAIPHISYFETDEELVLDVCDTLEEAKAVCQKHFESLILSALETEDE